MVNTWNLKSFVLHFDLEMLPCCNERSCFIFLLSHLVSLPLRVRVRVSNAFYASLRLLKAGNFGGLPSLTQFSVIHARNPHFGHVLGSFLAVYWSCKVVQVGQGKPTSFFGLAPSPDRVELHIHSAVSLSSDTRLPLYPENLPTV